jgi:hypothetical protein
VTTGLPTQGIKEETMPYICLGYLDAQQWEAMSDSERNALMDACFVYDDVLRTHGHLVGGEALQSAQHATTLRYQNGTVSLTDGPYAETKEQLGGILMLEATDLHHAIPLMSQYPRCAGRPLRDSPG